MIYKIFIFFLTLFTIHFSAYAVDELYEHPQSYHQRMNWFYNAKFGLFIHWGLYAIPAGEWKGVQYEGIGEQIQGHARIPNQEYEELAGRFNPTEFDAEEWVQLAKQSGMRYIVITAKHVDGFAMFDSPSSGYDIVDATPYGRDIMQELSKACEKAGIRLCFYYSQERDWHEFDALTKYQNTWDFPDDREKKPERYLRKKVKPQLRELLTQYGPVGLIWFDVPYTYSYQKSLDLKKYVRDLQPQILVNSRIGNDLGDYESMGDNQLPVGRYEKYWETPATMNDTWGYKSFDDNWKSVQSLLELLVDIVSKGGNYLLNVGPTAKGTIPQPSVDRLQKIGDWLDKNGEAIYATHPNPFPYLANWGRITCTQDKMYLSFFKWPKDTFLLYGIKTKITNAFFLANGKQIPFSQTTDTSLNHHVLELKLPSDAPDPYISVVGLDLKDPLVVDTSPIQQPDGAIHLLPNMAILHTNDSLHVDKTGLVRNWFSTDDYLHWEFKVFHPGRYRVEVNVVGERLKTWRGGHTVALRIDNQKLTGIIHADEMVKHDRARYYPEAITKLGIIEFNHPGQYKLVLEAIDINSKLSTGLAVASVNLYPVID
jgi:alpha-L-fucosidase